MQESEALYSKRRSIVGGGYFGPIILRTNKGHEGLSTHHGEAAVAQGEILSRKQHSRLAR